MNNIIPVRQPKIKNKKMFRITNNRKTVIIRDERRSFRSPQFNSNYPKRLTEIIHPDAFQQSIANINRAARPTVCEKILIFILFLCSLVGLLIFIGGILVIWLSIPALSIPLMSVGFAIFMGFFTIMIFVSSRIYRSCDTRREKAVAAESMKYSKKLPVPTRWRLDMTIYTRRFSTASPTDIQNFLLIEIDERAGLKIRNNPLNSNSYSSKPTRKIGQQYSSFPLLSSKTSLLNSSDKTLHIEKQADIHSPT